MSVEKTKKKSKPEHIRYLAQIAKSLERISEELSTINERHFNNNYMDFPHVMDDE